jgi:hypothetical protein
MKINPQSQTGKILDYLLAGNRISPLEALEKFGSFRLSERIREIEAAGYFIEHIPLKIGKKRVMEYRIEKIASTIVLPSAFAMKPVAPKQTMML